MNTKYKGVSYQKKLESYLFEMITIDEYITMCSFLIIAKTSLAYLKILSNLVKHTQPHSKMPKYTLVCNNMLKTFAYIQHVQ